MRATKGARHTPALQARDFHPGLRTGQLGVRWRKLPLWFWRTSEPPTPAKYKCFCTYSVQRPCFSQKTICQHWPLLSLRFQCLSPGPSNYRTPCSPHVNSTLKTSVWTGTQGSAIVSKYSSLPQSLNSIPWHAPLHTDYLHRFPFFILCLSFLFLAASGLSWGTQALHCSVQASLVAEKASLLHSSLAAHTGIWDLSSQPGNTPCLLNCKVDS